MTTKPHFKVVAIDATWAYSEGDLKTKCGKIFSTYLVDVNRHIHLCELTPSYELHFIENLASNCIDDDTDEELRDCGYRDEPVTYTHARHIDKLPPESFVDLGEHEIPENYEELLEEVQERVRTTSYCPAIVC